MRVLCFGCGQAMGIFSPTFCNSLWLLNWRFRSCNLMRQCKLLSVAEMMSDD